MQASLAGKDFTAEREHVIVISTGAVEAVDLERLAAERTEAEQRNRHRCAYTYGMHSVTTLAFTSVAPHSATSVAGCVFLVVRPGMTARRLSSWRSRSDEWASCQPRALHNPFFLYDCSAACHMR